MADYSKYAEAIGADNDYASSGKNGATGKYRFSWDLHAPEIIRITGVKNRQEFLDSPEAQDKYFEWHMRHNVAPAIQRLSAYNKSGVDDAEVGRLIHTYGESGAKKKLQSYDAPQSPAIALHVMPEKAGDVNYRYIHQDSRGNNLLLHEGNTPLTQQQLDDMVAVSRAHPYDPHNEGAEVGYIPSLMPAQAQPQQPEAPQPMQMHPDTQFSIVHYDAHGNIVPEDTKEFGTDFAAFDAANRSRIQRQQDEFKDYGDPTKNINYVAPSEPVAAAPQEDEKNDRVAHIGKLLNGIFGTSN